MLRTAEFFGKGQREIADLHQRKNFEHQRAIMEISVRPLTQALAPDGTKTYLRTKKYF